ncbi:hypothetical protein F5051DRAFT_502838 [Lentinula edodes]|nr:hypothetical protein F5051DRAFT_502838 [Lentinula edodes]
MSHTSLLLLPSELGLTVLALMVFFAMCRFQSSASKGSYPPGPKVVNMPTLNAWVKYRDWGNKYGDLVYLPEWNTLITNDAGVAIDLLEKRARIYSDRAMSPIMKLCGGENLFFPANIFYSVIPTSGVGTGAYSSRPFVKLRPPSFTQRNTIKFTNFYANYCSRLKTLCNISMGVFSSFIFPVEGH